MKPHLVEPLAELELQLCYLDKCYNSGDNIKQYGLYPAPGVRYIKSFQLYLVVKRLKLKPENTYTLFLWDNNDEKNIKKIVRIYKTMTSATLP